LNGKIFVNALPAHIFFLTQIHALYCPCGRPDIDPGGIKQVSRPFRRPAQGFGRSEMKPRARFRLAFNPHAPTGSSALFDIAGQCSFGARLAYPFYNCIRLLTAFLGAQIFASFIVIMPGDDGRNNGLAVHG
jgi:hypothetical protein